MKYDPDIWLVSDSDENKLEKLSLKVTQFGHLWSSTSTNYECGGGQPSKVKTGSVLLSFIKPGIVSNATLTSLAYTACSTSPEEKAMKVIFFSGCLLLIAFATWLAAPPVNVTDFTDASTASQSRRGL